MLKTKYVYAIITMWFKKLVKSNILHWQLSLQNFSTIKHFYFLFDSIQPLLKLHKVIASHFTYPYLSECCLELSC